MDELLVTARELRDEFGETDDQQLAKTAMKNGRVLKILPHELDLELRRKYTDYLVLLTQKYVEKFPDIRTWEDFSTRKDTRRIQSLLFEFGIRAEVFPDLEQLEEPVTVRSPTSITIAELYEVCQVKFHYSGTLLAFKRVIQRQYGSFAEYCIIKGYDINSTKWESDDTAIRVAQKLGSIERVKLKSKSLYNYLIEKDLLDTAFETQRKSG